MTTPLEHATRWKLENSGQSTGDVSSARYPNPYASRPPPELASDTGELRWRHTDQKRGVIIVNTPRSQSLIGFVRGSGESTPHLSADVTNEFCVLTLTALDDQPIAQSGRLLLVATPGAAVNTGQRFAEDGKTLADWGQGPVLIEPVVGLVALRGLESPSAIRGQPLTPEGRPLGPPKPATRSKTGWEFQLGEPATTCWLLEAER